MKLREKFVYRWNFKERDTNFYKEGFLRMNDLRKNRKYCDVILVATGENGDQQVEIFAHKIVLTVSSPYFSPLFGMMESNTEKIEIKIDPDTLETFVDFLYTAQLTIEEDKVREMIEAANYFHVDDLVKQCEDYLIGSVDNACCLQLHEFALMYNLSKLAEASLDHAIKNFEKILITDFTKMSEETLTRVISSDDLRVMNEEVVFQKTMAWVRAEETRKEALPRLLKYIRFHHMNMKYIMAVAEDRTIDADPNCRKAIREVIKDKLFINDPFSFGSSARAGQMRTRTHYHPSASYPFSVSNEHWLPAPTLGGKVKWHAATVVDKKIFCVGGNNGMRDLNTVQFLNPIMGTWQTARPLPFLLSSPGLTWMKKYLYAVGGLSNDKPTKAVHVYDVNTDVWMEGASTLENRCDSVESWNGVLYAAGSENINAKSSSAEMWDTRTAAWQQLPPMLTERSRPKLAAVNGRIFAIGDGNGDVNTIEVFEPRAASWYPHNALITAAQGYAVTVCNDDIVLSGGRKKGSAGSIHQLKVLRKDRWIDGPDVLAQSHHALCALDGTLFSVGGYSYLELETAEVHCLALDIDNV